jgi:hypothetical protein
MSDMADEEQLLKVALMRADLNLKMKQSFWETPKAILLIVATTAAIIGTLSGVLGYKIGNQPQPPQPAPQVIFQPGAIQITPPRATP